MKTCSYKTMGIVNEAQTLIKKSKGTYEGLKANGLSNEEQRLMKYVESRVLSGAKKGDNMSRFQRVHFTDRVIDELRKEGLIVWDNSEVVTVIVPIN